MPDNMFPEPGVEWRFPVPGEDEFFPEPEQEWRFHPLGVDQMFPAPGVDWRFAEGEPAAPVLSSVSLSASGGYVGLILSASASFSGVPRPTLSYDWRVDGVSTGAVNAMWQTDAAGAVTCVVTATNVVGSVSLETAPATIVTPTLQINSLQVLPAGGPVGTTFTASLAAVADPAASAAFTWLLDDVAVATGLTFTPTTGGSLAVYALLQSLAGTAEAESDPVVVTPNAQSPAVTSPPTMSSPRALGIEITATPGVYSGVPEPDVTRRWELNGIPTGETGLTFTPVIEGDLRYVETASNTSGSVQAAAGPFPIFADNVAPVVTDVVVDMTSVSFSTDEAGTAHVGLWNDLPAPEVLVSGDGALWHASSAAALGANSVDIDRVTYPGAYLSVVVADEAGNVSAGVIETLTYDGLRASVEALAASAGRTSEAALKVVGVDALPAGVTVSGSIITMSAYDTVLEGWDLTGYRVVPEGLRQAIRQCHLGEETGPVGNLLYYVNIGPLADDLIIENNDFIGFIGVGGAGTMINQQFIGTQAIPIAARRVIIRENVHRHADGDCIKVFGGDFRIERNFFDVVSCYPPGTAPWAVDTVYVVDPTGLDPLGCCLNSSGFLFVAKNAGTLPSPPLSKTSTADWTAVDPHTDLITVRGAVGDDHLILNNYFISQVGARCPGLTQQIRYVRNTGTPTPGNAVRIIGNVFEEWGGFYPFAVSGIREFIANRPYPAGDYCTVGNLRYRSLQGGNSGNAPETSPSWWEQVFDIAFDGPAVFQHNWMGSGKTGVKFAPTGMDDSHLIWGDNLDVVTEQPVQAPNYAIVTSTPQPAFGSAGSAPVPQTYGPFTAFDIVPTEYGDLQVGNETLTAVAVHVHGQLAAYWEEGETPVVLTDRDFTLTDQGGGVWRLQNGAAEEVVVTVSTGVASVAEINELPETMVVGIFGQSQMEYLTNPGGTYGRIADPTGIPSTPNVTAWTDATRTGSSPPVKTVVTAANVAAGLVNPVIANWSVFWNRVAPGVYFHVVDLCVPGTGRASLASNSHPDARWPGFLNMLQAVRAEGLEFDAILENWQANDSSTAKTFPECWSPFYFGQRWGGQPFSLGSTNPDMTAQTATIFNNCLWDIEAASDQKGRGVFTRDRTKLWFSGWPTFSGHPASPTAEGLNFTTKANGSPESSYPTQLDAPARRRLDEFVADGRVATFRGGVIGGAHIADMGGGVHPNRDDSDGQILMSIGLAAAALKAAGLTISDPQITGVTIPSGGAWADISVSLPNGGDLTTVRALESRAAPSVEPPHYQPVMGFEIRRVGDTDAQRRPVFKTSETGYPAAYRGTVAIVNSGSGTPRTGTIRITPTVAFAEGDRIEFDRGDASAILQTPRDTNAKIYLNQPLESVPAWRNVSATYPFPGIAVKPQPPTLVIGEVATGALAPSNTALPSISGTLGVGETLTADDGTWTGDATITFTRIWRRDGATIPAATGATYDQVAADVGKNITIAVTASNGAGSATAVSAPVGPVPGEDTGGTDFFTAGPTGPYFVDPSNIPANTTRIEYEAVLRLTAEPTTGVNVVASQESTGADVQIGYTSGGTVWRAIVEDGGGAKMIAGTSTFSEILPESGGPAGQWFKLYVDIDFGTNSMKIYVNDALTDTIPFIATPSPASFQTGREIAFLATTGGGNPIAGNNVGSVDVEYVEAWFTTGGSRTLRKRVAGSAATVNADPWKRGADAT